jgi:hypothetical protein
MNAPKKKYPNSGTLFPIEGEKKEPWHADLEGRGFITCPHCQKEAMIFLGGTRKEGPTGGKFLVIKFKAVIPRSGPPVPAEPKGGYDPKKEYEASLPKPINREDDVPF